MFGLEVDVTEFELFKSLKSHYPPREFALIPQVGNRTGFGTSRHADALALGLWPSRGMRLHGFEIKSHRGDWVRELADPAKAEEISQFCNHWWIVAANDAIVKDGELPPTWGLYVFNPEKESLIRKVAAPTKEAKTPGLDFIAAMLRRAQEVVTPDAVVKEAVDRAVAQTRKDTQSHNKYELDLYTDLKRRVAEFEKKTGVRISGWRDIGAIGDAVEQVLNGSTEQKRQDLISTARLVLKEFGITELSV